MKSTLRLAVFLAAAALTVLLQAQSLVVYDANTPAENLRSLGNAKFQQTPDGLLIETQGSQAQGKEVFPGVAIVGDWDLTDFNVVEVVAGHRDHKSMFNLTIRLAAGENNLGGQSNAYIADTGVSTEPAFAPCWFRSTGKGSRPPAFAARPGTAVENAARSWETKSPRSGST